MPLRQMRLHCHKCGDYVPGVITSVGFTCYHQLVVTFWCAVCKMEVHLVKDLAQCWRDCPTFSEEGPDAEIAAQLPKVSDADFLHSLGVASLDEEEYN